MRRLYYPISWLLGFRQIPYSSRGIFRREFFHMLCWGVVWGSLNGGFCGYIARRSFSATALVVSVIAAAMAFANLFAVWWAALSRTRSRRVVMTTTLLGTGLVLMTVAATPLSNALPSSSLPGWFRAWTSQTQPLTAFVFTVQIALAWIVIKGTNTVRTTIWKINYPAKYRGRILARFAVWQILVGALWGAFIGAYLDGALTFRSFGGHNLYHLSLHWLPAAGARTAYAIVLPIAGLAALVSLYFYRRIPIRRPAAHEPAHNPPQLRAGIQHDPLEVDDRAGTETSELNYATPGWFATRWGVLRAGFQDSLDILRRDSRFRSYMMWMFLSGSSIMMINVPFVLILEDAFDINYLQAAGLLAFAPQVALALFTPLWARLFDHWSIYKYRSIQMLTWTISRAALSVGIWQRHLGIVLVAVLLGGAALAGGRFAWHLGHMSFSNQANDSTYLGIHQTLTGIRGLIMPFLGAGLYLYLMDWHVIWISAALLALAAAGYWRLHLTETAAVRA